MDPNDELFRPQDVFDASLYRRGLFVEASEHFRLVVKEDPEKSAHRSVVVPLQFGSIYVVTFPQKTERLRAAVAERDPDGMKPGEAAVCTVEARLQNVYWEKEPEAWDGFLYTTERESQYLVIYTGDTEETPLKIERIPVLLGRDTDDDWYRPGPQKDLKGGPDSWGKWDWTAEEVLEHVYEPLRRAYPAYISRQCIGRDQSGKYPMWAYTFEPENYEQTLFITGGMHAAEMDGYLGLARFFELMVKEDGSHAGLHYLRTKVKIVLIPIINVYSASEEHIRQNSRGKDLNRDYELHTEAETINVIWLLEQYKDEAAALIDYHTCKGKRFDLYYNFSVQAPNCALCCRVTNHIYEDLKARGLADCPPVMELIPGAYEKHDKYLQGYAWNRLGIPTLVAEHQHEKYAEPHSALGLELAVEYYGNFMIQTALARLKLRSGKEK